MTGEWSNRIRRRFWSKVDIRGIDECWNWTAAQGRRGYGRFGIDKDTKFSAHRFSWELTYGSIPDEKVVMHKCDNTSCVNPFHLQLGTVVDNLNDCKQKGRWVNGLAGYMVHGEKHLNAKLTDHDVVTIIELKKAKMTNKSVAELFDVSESTVQFICTGKTWTHIRR